VDDHLVTGLPHRDALPDRRHHPGPVGPRNVGEGLGGRQTVGDEDVEVVESGHFEVDDNLVEAWRRIVDLSQSQGFGAFDVVEEPGTHRGQGRRYIRSLREQEAPPWLTI
jgi:hypothetical protein